MAIRVGIGNSRQSDSFQAGQEAAAHALESLGSLVPTVVFVFASVRFEQEALLKGIVSQTKQVPLIGCSTAGEIHSTGPSRRGVVVAAVQSDGLRIAAALGKGLNTNSRQAGRDVADQVMRARLPDPHGLLLFPDGLSGNIAEVIRGAQDILGLSFPIVGGSAGDDLGFQKTFQYFHGTAFSDTVVGLLCAGNIAFGVGTRHGWQPMGKPKRVTRAFANTLSELDGKSAARLYESYFNTQRSALKNDELAKISIMYPLGFPIPGEEEYLLRNAIRANPDGSLTLTGEIPEGSEVRLMMGSKAQALAASKRAAEQALQAIAPQNPEMVLLMSCTSRAQLFGRNLGAELRIIREVVGKDVPLFGFYDYGEQAPLTSSGFHGQSYFHNESALVVTLADHRTISKTKIPPGNFKSPCP